MKKRIALFTLLISIIALFPNKAIASSGPANLTVSPYIQSVTINKGDNSTIEFLVRNNLNSTIEIRLGFVNFKAPADKSGTPDYFVDNSYNSYYPMTWFQTGSINVNIPSQSYVKIPVKVAVPNDATPGGHYGGVLFSSQSSGSNGNIGLNGKVGVPVLITVPGAINHNLKIKSFSISPYISNFLSLFKSDNLCFSKDGCNTKSIIDFKNDGNVHEAPVGLVEVYDMFGNKILTNNYNPNGQVVLPGSERIIYDNLDFSKLGQLKLGLYTAKLSMVYVSNPVPAISETKFILIDWSIVLFALLIILALAIVYGYRRKSSKNKTQNN